MMAARRGRRPGKRNTREKILKAAQDAFSTAGFEGTSIRQIAEAAEVDAALVHHYFGTKEELFTASVEFPSEPASLIARITDGPIETIGVRVAETFISTWDDPITGPRLEALLRRALSNRQVSKLVKEFFAVQIVRQVSPILDGAIDRHEIPGRASLVMSQLFGIAVARHLIKMEPIASMSRGELVAAVAPTVQRYLTGEIGSDQP